MKSIYLKDVEGFLELGSGEFSYVDLVKKETIVSKYADEHAFIKVAIADLSAVVEDDGTVRVTWYFRPEDLIKKDKDPGKVKQLEAEVVEP